MFTSAADDDQSYPEIGLYSGGGAVCDYNSTALFANCTFVYNFADANGGAILSYGSLSDSNYVNCIFWGNDANAFGDEIFNVESANPNFAYCDIKAICYYLVTTAR